MPFLPPNQSTGWVDNGPCCVCEMFFGHQLCCTWAQEREMAEMKEQDRMLELEKKIIDEERERLLREHAPKLIGYLPKVSMIWLLAVTRN